MTPASARPVARVMLAWALVVGAPILVGATALLGAGDPRAPLAWPGLAGVVDGGAATAAARLGLVALLVLPVVRNVAVIVDAVRGRRRAATALAVVGTVLIAAVIATVLVTAPPATADDARELQRNAAPATDAATTTP